LSSVTFALRTRTFRSLRRHYNYRLFFAGQVVSLAGSWMQNVALAWLVLSLSHSPIAVALLLFCRFVPYTLFGLFAGSVVDRFETRLLVIWTQAAAMLVSAALAFVSLTGTATLPVVYVLATIGGIAVVLDAPGRQSLTFEMVGPRELPNAVALNSGLVNASRIVGPALAGIIIAVAGVGLCFIVNTISFLAVLAALLLMRTDELFPVAADRTVTLKRAVRVLAPSSSSDAQLSDRIRPLDLANITIEEWEEVVDPAGGEQPEFDACAQEIDELVDQLIALL